MTKFAIIVTVLSLIFHVQGVHGECERLRVSGAKYQKSTDGVYEAMYNYYCSGRPVYQQSNQVQGQNYLYYYEEEYKFSGWQIGIAPCANEPVIAVQDASHSPDRVKVAWHEFRDPFWIENRRISVECLDFTLSNWTVAGIALGVVVIISIVLSAAWRMCHQFRAAQRRSRRSRRSAHSRSTYNDDSSSISPYGSSYYDAIQKPPSYNDVLKFSNPSAVYGDIKPPSYDSIQSETNLFYTEVSGSLPVVTSDRSVYSLSCAENSLLTSVHTIESQQTVQPPAYDDIQGSSTVVVSIESNLHHLDQPSSSGYLGQYRPSSSSRITSVDGTNSGTHRFQRDKRKTLCSSGNVNTQNSVTSSSGQISESTTDIASVHRSQCLSTGVERIASTDETCVRF